MGRIFWGSTAGLCLMFGGVAHAAANNQELEAALRAIRARESSYHRCHPQDNDGRGFECEKPDSYSEKIPPYVLSPRRQTDSLVKQAYALLPESIRAHTAFVITDRLVQDPESYLPYIDGKREVILVGSFMGTGDVASDEDRASENLKIRHAQELWALDASLRLVRAAGHPVKRVVFSMGDSNTAYGLNVRDKLQAKFDAILDQHGAGALKRALSWGADETMVVAFAGELPVARVRVRISNPDALQEFDGRRPAGEILREKLPELGLEPIDTDDADFEISVLTRRPGKDSIFDAGDTREQKIFDRDFLAHEAAYTPAQRKKLVRIDARVFNGAWESEMAPSRCDLLAFGSWGTYGNTVGSTLALAKILRASGNEDVRRQMLIESVAHDVFVTGYEESQMGELKTLLLAQGIPFDHFEGFASQGDTTKAFEVINAFVNKRMQAKFRGSDCLAGRHLRVTPQFWRTFESEVHLWPSRGAELFKAGVFRRDLPRATFDPTFEL